MTRLILALILSVTWIGSSFGQAAPDSAKKPASMAKSKPAASGCKLVGTVKGTKLWAGDCAAPDQLRSSMPATEGQSLPDQAAGAIPPGQK